MTESELSNSIYTLQNKQDKTPEDFAEIERLNTIFIHNNGDTFPMKID